MRSLLSRLAFWWAALAVGLSLFLPLLLERWVAALAVGGAALSLLIGWGSKHAAATAGPAPAAAIDVASLLETAAMVVRSTAHAHDLPEAMHGVARILFQELGADGLVTGRLDETGALSRLDRFADQATRCPAPPREPLSPIATQAIKSQSVQTSPEGAFAVPVLRAGNAVGWLEFKSLEMNIAPPALMHLLDLVRLELSAVAERSRMPGARADTAIVARDGAGSAVRRPVPNESRPLVTRYQPRRAAACADPESEGSQVLDHNALNRLRELDPNGVNRLLERVAKAFESSANRMIPQLREGARTGDLAGVGQVAHTLKSASASIGAMKLSRLCADIETRAHAEDDEDLGAHVKTMVAEIDTVLSVVRSLPATRE